MRGRWDRWRRNLKDESDAVGATSKYYAKAIEDEDDDEKENENGDENEEKRRVEVQADDDDNLDALKSAFGNHSFLKSGPAKSCQINWQGTVLMLAGTVWKARLPNAR